MYTEHLQKMNTCNIHRYTHNTYKKINGNFYKNVCNYYSLFVTSSDIYYVKKLNQL